MKRGATSIRAPWDESDELGTVVMATVATYGDTEHTFVERKNYKGVFLPGYKAYQHADPLSKILCVLSCFMRCMLSSTYHCRVLQFVPPR